MTCSTVMGGNVSRQPGQNHRFCRCLFLSLLLLLRKVWTLVQTPKPATKSGASSPRGHDLSQPQKLFFTKSLSKPQNRLTQTNQKTSQVRISYVPLAIIKVEIRKAEKPRPPRGFSFLNHNPSRTNTLKGGTLIMNNLHRKSKPKPHQSKTLHTNHRGYTP